VITYIVVDPTTSLLEPTAIRTIPYFTASPLTVPGKTVRAGSAITSSPPSSKSASPHPRFGRGGTMMVGAIHDLTTYANDLWSPSTNSIHSRLRLGGGEDPRFIASSMDFLQVATRSTASSMTPSALASNVHRDRRHRTRCFATTPLVQPDRGATHAPICHTWLTASLRCTQSNGACRG
jgi:hypothetical protein